jgi:predicted DNA-binding protein YlxM (UPF0122 family)
LASVGWEGLMGMIGVDKIGEIRRAYFEQDRSIKEIVRTLLVSRATVRKVIRGHKTEFKYGRGVQANLHRKPLLDLQRHSSTHPQRKWSDTASHHCCTANVKTTLDDGVL